MSHEPDEASSENILEKCRSDLGDAPSHVEIVEWSQENFGVPITIKKTGAVVDESQMEAVRELLQITKRSWHIIVEYQANQKGRARDLKAGARTMALVLGFFTAAGASNIADLARLLKIKKQTLNKMAEHFQSRLKLPDRPGQRSDEACEHMKQTALNRNKKNE